MFIRRIEWKTCVCQVCREQILVMCFFVVLTAWRGRTFWPPPEPKTLWFDQFVLTCILAALYTVHSNTKRWLGPQESWRGAESAASWRKVKHSPFDSSNPTTQRLWQTDGLKRLQRHRKKDFKCTESNLKLPPAGGKSFIEILWI